MAIPYSLADLACDACVQTILNLRQDGNEKLILDNLDFAPPISKLILERIVSLYFNLFKDKHLVALSAPHIKELVLKSCKRITPSGLHAALRNCQVEQLNLKKCDQAGFFDYPHIECYILACPSLVSLCLDNTGIGDDVVKTVLKNVPHLKVLGLSCCPITDNAFILNENKMTNQIFSSALKSIDLSGCRSITSSAIHNLCAVCGPSLIHVDLSFTSVNGLALWYLAGYTFKSSNLLQMFLANFRDTSEFTVLIDQLFSLMKRCSRKEIVPERKNSINLPKPKSNNFFTKKFKKQSPSDSDNSTSSTSLDEQPVSDAESVKQVKHRRETVESSDDDDVANSTSPTLISSTNKVPVLSSSSSSSSSDNSDADVPDTKSCQSNLFDNLCQNLQDTKLSAAQKNSSSNMLSCDINPVKIKSCDTNPVYQEIRNPSHNGATGTDQLTDNSDGRTYTDAQSSNNTFTQNVNLLELIDVDTYLASCVEFNPVDQEDELQLEWYEPKITKLRIESVDFSNEDLTSICMRVFFATNRCLKDLSISWKAFSKELLEVIGEYCKELKYISLIDAELIENESLAKLGERCQKIDSMNLKGVIYCDYGNLLELFRRPYELLQFPECDIRDCTLSAIAHNSAETLTNLDLSWCENITEKSLMEVSTLCTELTNLSLHQCHISDVIVKSVAENCSKLKKLNLYQISPLTDESLIAIAKGLKFLEDLDISWSTEFTDKAIAVLLSHCSRLQRLELVGLKLITSKPFLHIISDYKRWLRSKAFLKLKATERSALNDDEFFSSSDEEYDDLYLPHRSSSYAANLRNLSLTYSDMVDDDDLSEIVAICRGSLRIVDYYGYEVEPCWVPGKSLLLFNKTKS